MTDYVCSNCGAPAYTDGNGEDVILLCGCDRREREWVEDGLGGGHWTNPTGARPIEVPYRSEAEEWDDWIRRRR